jgi:hypothetical protein
MESIYWQIFKYFETYEGEYIYETFTTFDDWSTFIPVFTLEEIGISLDHFTIPPYGNRNLTDLHPKWDVDQSYISMRHRLNSPLDNFDVQIKNIDRREYLRHAFHISVRSLKNQTVFIGNNRYMYHNYQSGLPNEVYWLQFKEDYVAARYEKRT